MRPWVKIAIFQTETLPAEASPSTRLDSMVPLFMAKTNVVPKKKRGPPATGHGVQIGERWHAPELAAIDAWISASADKTLNRAHAIRRLVAIGLKAKRASGHSEQQKWRAKEIAGTAIDAMSDDEAHADDQASRKRRLLKGPEEFREVRIDRKRK